MAKPQNALGVSVLDAPVAGDAAIAKGIVSLTGIPPIVYKDVTSFITTVFSAGVLQVEDIDFTGFVPVVGTAHKIILKANQKSGGVAVFPEGETKTYIIVASTTDVDDLGNQFKDAITNDLTSFVTAIYTAGTDVLELTQKNFDINGFSVPDSPVASVTNTGFTAPAGTPAVVQGFVDSSVTVGSSQYKKYEITLNKTKEFDSSGDVTAQKLVVIIFADDQDAGFAAFDTAIGDVFNAAAVGDAEVIKYLAT